MFYPILSHYFFEQTPKAPSGDLFSTLFSRVGALWQETAT